MFSYWVTAEKRFSGGALGLTGTGRRCRLDDTKPKNERRGVALGIAAVSFDQMSILPGMCLISPIFFCAVQCTIGG